MKEELNDIFKNLIVKHLTGQNSPEEEIQLAEWRAFNPDNEVIFAQYEKVFNLAKKQDREDLGIDIEQEWEHFLNMMKGEAKTIPIATPASRRTNWLQIAAVISLLIVAGVTGNYFLSKSSDLVFETASNTETVTLPDGSKVDLNQNSRLTYSDSFGETNRSVSLVGEGFFEVTPDKRKPFIIDVNQTQIQVIGTRFNVSGYSQNETIEVVVEEGLVNFSSGRSAVDLSAGEKGVYIKTQQLLKETPNNDVNFISWKTRKIVFIESKLPAVIETLNKVYGDQIIIASDISNSCEVTVTFNQQSLEAVLNVLKTTLNLTFRTNGDQIEIVDAECE